MNIGEASDATGVSAKMIRYYEETGLIAPAQRSVAGYRVYAENDIQTLRFIRRARDLGFTVKRIEDLLLLWRDRSRASGDVKRIATDHIADLQKKMRELQEMVTTLTHLAHNCHGDDRPDCPILTSLGEAGSVDAVTQKKTSSLGKGFEKKASVRR
jgi:MerR family copper efflux transcriptional regulator